MGSNRTIHAGTAELADILESTMAGVCYRASKGPDEGCLLFGRWGGEVSGAPGHLGSPSCIVHPSKRPDEPYVNQGGLRPPPITTGGNSHKI